MLKISHNRKIIAIIVMVLLLFAGIIALTQELDEILPELNEEYDLLSEIEAETDLRPVKQTQWFRSNAGGMALEETHSRFVALRSEYALAIEYSYYDELPELLLPFYNDDYFPEIRTLFKNGNLVRTQWILRDRNMTTRVNAVFIEPKETDNSAQAAPSAEQTAAVSERIADNSERIADNGEQAADNSDQITEDAEQAGDNSGLAAESGEHSAVVEQVVVKEEQVSYITGFIEIFDENSFLSAEFRYLDNGDTQKIQYVSKDNLIISAGVLLKEKNSNDFVVSYTDYYRYNRSLSLRSVERILNNEIKTDDPVIYAFPRRIMDALNEPFFSSQRLNVFPEFFGNVFAHNAASVVYESDDRGRIVTQTLYDDSRNVIWVIRNRWSNDRIVSTSKTEGDTVLTAEFEYTSSGDRILERNLRNGVMERVVRTENKTDIEELYYNNVHVLTAVWVDGKKISETRVR